MKVIVFTLISAFTLQPALYATSPVQAPLQTSSTSNYNWDLSEIFKSKADWLAAIDKIRNTYLPALEDYKGKLADPKSLASYLDLYEEAYLLFNKLYIYAYLRSDLNNTDSEALEMCAQSEKLTTDFELATVFVEPELQALSTDALIALKNAPELSKYQHYLEDFIRSKQFILSEEESALLSLFDELSSSPEEIYAQASISDLTYPAIKDNNGNTIIPTSDNYLSLLKNLDRTTRKAAYQSVLGAYDKIKNTLAATLNAEVKKNVVFANAYGFDSAKECALTANDIPIDVYDNLIKAVNQNLDGLHKYVTLKQKYLGLDKVHYYDLYVPLVTEEPNVSYTFDDAKKIVLEGLSPLGETYCRDLAKAFDSHWVDVYEKPNKTTGAYCWNVNSVHPFVLFNFTGTLTDVSSVAHEFGHAMNNFYSDKAQPLYASGTSIFTAEVASTTNELIMFDYLIDHATSDEEKLYLLNYYIEQIRASLYTQTMYAEFEETIHEKIENGEALTSDYLSDTWGELMKKYYGDAFEDDALANMWWARIHHFYQDFYVYQYATGISAAYALRTQIKSKDPAKLDAYLTFLASGSSDYPVETLKKAGVDMSTTQPVEALLNEFEHLVDEMEALLIKTGKMK